MNLDKLVVLNDLGIVYNDLVNFPKFRGKFPYDF